MNTIYPQRAKGTHRAEGASLLPTGKNIVSSLFKVSFFTLIYCDQTTDDIYYKYTPSARFFKAKYTKNKRARSMKNR